MKLHDKTIEECVLGAMLGEPTTIPGVMDILITGDFFYVKNQTVFTAIQKLFENGKEVDIVTVSDELKKEGTNDWYKYISDIVSTTPTFANAESYAEAVREHSIRRQIVAVCKDTVKTIPEKEGAEALGKIQNDLMQIDSHDDRNMTHHSMASMEKHIITTNKLMKSKGHNIGIKTGLYQTDAIISGLNDTDLIILASRPSVGKSSLATQILLSAIEQENIPLLFSLEMSEKQVVDRLVSGLSGISLGNVRHGQFNNDKEIEHYTQTAGNLAEKSWGVNDSGSITVGRIRAEALKFKLRYGLDLIIVDYLQLIDSGSTNENRQNQISTISRQLKILAKDFGVPVVVLSQLSRACEAERREPRLSDLRDSGAIEQDADIVMFLHRYVEDGFYKHRLIVAKNRNGVIGRVGLEFNNNTTTFKEVFFEGY